MQPFTYQIPAGVEAREQEGRPLLTTPQGGLVAVDRQVLALWEYADGRTLDEVIAGFPDPKTSMHGIRAGLCCLAEAGVLQRSNWTEPKPEVQPVEGPLVSVVIVAYNSVDWLRDCLPSLNAQSYQPLEIVVVDNGSQDGVLEWLQEEHPQVCTLQFDEPLPFSSATNRGVKAARGEYILLLNPDTYLEPDAVARMVSKLQETPESAAVGAKLKFWWAPAFLNGLGNRVGAISWGTDNGLGHLDLGQFDHWEELPSACYAAVLIARMRWDVIGPADEGFPMYYEDVEWSYRARLLGYPIKAAPDAVVYHAFGGRVPSGEDSNLTPRKLRNVVYGRQRFALKLVGRYLGRFLRNYWMEDWANFVRLLGLRDWAAARAYLGGWGLTLRKLPSIWRERRALQARRAISDQDLFLLQRELPIPLAWHGLPELTFDLILHHYWPLLRDGRTRAMPEFPEKRLHLLIVSNDVVDVKMAGPGMRYLEMARALSANLDVTLAVPNETSLQIPGIRLIRYKETSPESVQALVENSEIALISGYMVSKFPFLQYSRARLVVDYYDPIVLENLHYYLNDPIEDQVHLNEQAVFVTNRLAQIGDFFICGNERQRDYWMGVLSAASRINPYTFAQDKTLRSLIDTVSIGFPDREPRREPFLRGIHPQITENARIVLWGGGIWNWLDPLTVIRAWPQVIAQNPDARLVFLGTRHPNPLVPQHEMAKKAEDLAAEIGEKDRTIIFIEWVSYEERESLLSEADVGITMHPVHVETRYSLRTRVLDYLWARLPVLITDGDVTSEWVREYQLGEVVPPFDVDAVAQGLIRILGQPKEDWAPAFEPLHATMTWEKAVEPLLRYCLEGGYASDRQERGNIVAGSPHLGRLARARFIWRTQGARGLAYRVMKYIQWRLSQF